MSNRTFKVWRGNKEGGGFEEYKVDVQPGMVVLDVLHKIQAQAQVIRVVCFMSLLRQHADDPAGEPIVARCPHRIAGAR